MSGQMDPMPSAEPPYKITLIKATPSVIEVICEGDLVEGAHEYLPALGEMVKRESGDVTILYNTLSMRSYHFSFPMKHIPPFRNWLGKLRKVAVAHKIPSIGFAIATVSLATKVHIKGFPERNQAIAWLTQK